MKRLNLGCGPHPASGWMNIDLASDHNRLPDVECDIMRELPIEPGTATHLYAGHVLEHIERDLIVPMLDLWHSYAAPDCILMVVGPDVARSRVWLDDGRMTQKEYEATTTHDHEDMPDGVGHHWDCTEAEILDLLNASKWCNTKAIDIGTVPAPWPVVSRIGWQFAAVSTFA